MASLGLLPGCAQEVKPGQRPGQRGVAPAPSVRAPLTLHPQGVNRPATLVRGPSLLLPAQACALNSPVFPPAYPSPRWAVGHPQWFWIRGAKRPRSQRRVGGFGRFPVCLRPGKGSPGARCHPCCQQPQGQDAPAGSTREAPCREMEGRSQRTRLPLPSPPQVPRTTLSPTPHSALGPRSRPPRSRARALALDEGPEELVWLGGWGSLPPAGHGVEDTASAWPCLALQNPAQGAGLPPAPAGDGRRRGHCQPAHRAFPSSAATPSRVWKCLATRPAPVTSWRGKAATNPVSDWPAPPPPTLQLSPPPYQS